MSKSRNVVAMSRRKLGSRPQHLSAIQGKPMGGGGRGGGVVGEATGVFLRFYPLKKKKAAFQLCLTDDVRIAWMRAG